MPYGVSPCCPYGYWSNARILRYILFVKITYFLVIKIKSILLFQNIFCVYGGGHPLPCNLFASVPNYQPTTSQPVQQLGHKKPKQTKKSKIYLPKMYKL